MMTALEPLLSVTLTGDHRLQSRTTHTVYGQEMPRPARLTIAVYPGEDGVYLLYLDERGNEMTDTFHDTIDAAKAQADFEFGINHAQWTATQNCRANV